MKKGTFLFLFAVLFSFPGNLRAQSIWDVDHLERVRQSLDAPYYAAAYRHLLAEADALLEAEPLSVMMKEKMPASGDKHDYMSQARYFWPDPSQPDGLPYINRDGVSNPELETLDRVRLGQMTERVEVLSLAWFFSGDEKYARKAVEQLRTWFLDKETRMNPHLEYAQVVWGRYDNKGRSYGVLDGYSFVGMLDAAALLERSKSFPAKDVRALKAWFSKLLDWMLTSPQGRGEIAAENNHGTACDAQIVAFALYTQRTAVAREFIEALPARRIFSQIEPDGRQPQELRRTLAFGYSQYNLTHFIDLFRMARKLGISVDIATSDDGRNFYKAMDFLAAYTGKSAAEWPYQQISEWDSKQQLFCKDLYKAYLLDPARKDYLRLYKAHRVVDFTDRFNLLYVDATETDNAYAFAAEQLKYAMACTDKAKKEAANASKRKVSPCTVGKDGSLTLVHPHDWRSGFFPGTLWQVYAYTHDDFWRERAVSYTWPIEEAKWHRGTHDLGFMMNCSFGKAYELTGERSSRDVVLQSARTLITRYSDKVKSIRSWDHNRDRWKYPVIIDNMMNLEMLFRATELTGDSTFYRIAVNHANTTMKNHFRSDFSSYHVVDYDPETGEVRMKCTHQGYSDDSFWSRGQGWGVYGYAMCYRYTHDPAYLAQAVGIADFILGWPNMPEDMVPYWDMKEPRVAACTSEAAVEEVPRDASAAALIASGLYELSTYVGAEQAARYRMAADRIVESLNRHYRAEPGTNCGFLLLHSTGNLPAGSEIDVPLCYADYYYLEAAARKEALDNE